MKPRFTFLISTILLLLLQAGNALAQDITFNRIALAPDGPVSSAITGITQDPKQGTGLGLSLSYDIIKSHGGEIEVETKENEGAEFTVILPVS